MSSLDQRAEAAQPVGTWDDVPAALSATGVVKSFGATRALRGANLALLPAEVHALVGENGAGKSTLVKILVGALLPDAGTLMLGEAPLILGSVREAVAAGIVPVYQHLTLMPHLSVTENLLAFELAAGSPWRGRPRRCTPDDARAMLAHVGLDVDPRVPVGRLSLAERQLVEIARGLGRDCRVLVLDEPTAALNRAEVDRLFAALRRIRDRGTAVLFISHKLGEVEEIADRVSVLRDGQSVLEGSPRAAVSSRALIELMIGHGVESGRLAPPPAEAELLRVEGLTAPGVFADLAVAVRRGEILGLAGLVGSGALEAAAALAGAFPFRQGSLRLDGRPLPTGDRVAAHRAGVALLPGEREAAGVFPGLSALTNASASILGELASFGWLRGRRERERILPWFQRLSVSPTAPGLAVERFSGGNQQKVLAFRSLAMSGMKLLVALDPTRGVDVGARAVIHEALARAAAGGAAVIVFSSDLEELVGISMAYGVDDEAKKAGVEVVKVNAGGDANVNQQISQIQDLIQRKVSAIIVGATNGDAVRTVVEQAVAARIPVVGLSSIPNSPKVASAVGADHYEMGKMQAQCLGKAMGGQGEVGMMAGPAGQTWSDKRADGFRETVAKEFPRVKIVTESRLADNRNAALRTTEDWIQRFPSLTGVYSATDDIGAGVVAALKAAGKLGNVKVSSSNLSPTAQQLLKSGEFVCVSIQQIVLQGRYAVREAIKAAKGEKTTPQVSSPALLVTTENLASVDLREVSAPAGYRP